MSDEAENPKVLDAARWIAERQDNEGGRIIPAVRAQFSLSMAEACRACALAQRFREAGRAGT